MNIHVKTTLITAAVLSAAGGAVLLVISHPAIILWFIGAAVVGITYFITLKNLDGTL
jgi:4-hydroxybenzoate polyprenyltransferase